MVDGIRLDSFYAGDDESKETVAGRLAVGLHPLDAGPSSWRER